MISNEKKLEIANKIKNNPELLKLLEEHDVKGLIAKFKEAAIDVSEGDITEYFVSSQKLSEKELQAVAGGYPPLAAILGLRRGPSSSCSQ